MTREEARLELDATTLRPQDASAEARAMAEQDAELGAWLKERRAFDEEIAVAFAHPAMPVGLRESLLQTAKKPTQKPRRWIKDVVVAVAACVALGWHFLWPEFGGLPKWQAESLAAVAQVEYGMSRLDQRASSLDMVNRYLIARGSPSPARLPGTIGQNPTFGCKHIYIGKRPATIICFQIDGGKEAHLVVMENTDLDDMPPQMKPDFVTRKNWNMAAWSDGKQTFLLATTADTAALKKLFGLT